MGLKKKLIKQKSLIAHKINIFNDLEISDEGTPGLKAKMKIARRIWAIAHNTENNKDDTP